MEIKITTETKKLYNGKALDKLTKEELIALVGQLEAKVLTPRVFTDAPQPKERTPFEPYEKPWNYPA